MFRTSVYLVIDFEATCEEDQPDYPHEIVEFPCVAISADLPHAVLGEFRTYVRPVITPTLSPFCTKLTGITQRDVDSAPLIQNAIEMFTRWVEIDKGFDPDTVAVVCDGPWDIRKFLQMHMTRGVTVPRYLRKWVNLRKTFRTFYNVGRTGNLLAMLSSCGLEFEGRAHSGIDDARNIARLFVVMQKQGCVMRVNESLPEGEGLRPCRAVMCGRSVESPHPHHMYCRQCSERYAIRTT